MSSLTSICERKNNQETMRSPHFLLKKHSFNKGAKQEDCTDGSRFR